MILAGNEQTYVGPRGGSVHDDDLAEVPAGRISIIVGRFQIFSAIQCPHYILTRNLAKIVKLIFHFHALL